MLRDYYGFKIRKEPKRRYYLSCNKYKKVAINRYETNTESQSISSTIVEPLIGGTIISYCMSEFKFFEYGDFSLSTLSKYDNLRCEVK